MANQDKITQSSQVEHSKNFRCIPLIISQMLWSCSYHTPECFLDIPVAT